MVSNSREGRKIFGAAILVAAILFSAALSADGGRFAVLALSEIGSKLIFYSLESEVPVNTIDMRDEIVLGIRFLPNGDLLVVSANSLFVIDADGEDREIHGFYDKRLGGYSFSDELIALRLLEYGIGHSGHLILVSVGGGVLGEMPINREIVSMSSGDRFIAVLSSAGPILYNDLFEDITQSERDGEAAGATGILALSGSGSAIAYSDNSAVVITANP